MLNIQCIPPINKIYIKNIFILRINPLELKRHKIKYKTKLYKEN